MIERLFAPEEGSKDTFLPKETLERNSEREKD